MTDIKKVEDALKNNFQEGINDFYVSYVIFPDGLIISADIHADMSDYLAENGLINEYVWEEKGTDIFTEDYNCVRCAKAEKEENYVELPLKPLTNAQYQSLTEWLDDNTYLFDDIHITVNRNDLDLSDVSRIYSYDEYTVDEIIGKIKRYYAFGKLQECRKSVVMGDKVRKNSKYTPLNEDLERATSQLNTYGDLHIWDEYTGGYGDQSNYMSVAYVGDNWIGEDEEGNDTILKKNLRGYIDYAIYDDEIYIQMIEVGEKYRRQGIATKMMDNLKKMYPGVKIHPGFTTKDGTEFFKNYKLEEVYPNKGESKKDFIARFMEVTKDEYPDIKQRYAVANSYWDRRDLKDENKEGQLTINEFFDEYEEDDLPVTKYHYTSDLIVTDDLYRARNLFGMDSYRGCYIPDKDLLGLCIIDSGIHDDLTTAFKDKGYIDKSSTNEIRFYTFAKNEFDENEIDDNIDYYGVELKQYEYDKFYLVIINESSNYCDFEQTKLFKVLGKPLSSLSYEKDEGELYEDLSKQQEEYFKNSKVRDKDGNLIVCYHGTPTPGFKEFGKERNSQFGKYKFGDANVNYFTTNKEAASSYTYLGYEKDGNVYACYINIENPYIVDNESEAKMRSSFNLKDKKLREKEVQLFDNIFNKWKGKFVYYTDFRFEELNKDLARLNLTLKPSDIYEEDVDPEDIEYFDLYNIGNNSYFGAERPIEYQYSTDELFSDDMYDELKETVIGQDEDDYYFSTDDIVRYVLELNKEGSNYDGIIIEDILDSKDAFAGIGTDVITIKSSNQIKLIDNENPTSSNRIDEDYDKEIVVYRVGQIDDFKEGLFFTDNLDYFDHSMTGYKKEDAKKYKLDLKNAKVFNPIKEWGLEVDSWAIIRGEKEFFDEVGFKYYDYLDDVDYDDEDEYHEVITDTDSLAIYGYENDYDVCVLEDIPSDYGRGPNYTEYCVYDKSLIEGKSNGWRLVKIEDDTPYETVNNVLTKYKGNEKSFTIPNNISKIGSSAFAYNETLEEVIIPSNVLYISEWAFSGCENLKKVIIEDNKLIAIDGYAFFGCSSLSEIDLPTSLNKLGTNAFAGTELKEVIIPEGVTVVSDGLFYKCSLLEKVILPEGILTIGEKAFCECVALKEINLPESVVTIRESAFDGCSSLEQLTIFRNVKVIGYSAFFGCDNLTIHYRWYKKEWLELSDRPIKYVHVRVKKESKNEELLNEAKADKTEEEVLKEFDEMFGQGDVYMWSTYILPNGHFLNPDNCPEFWEEVEPEGEHADFIYNNPYGEDLFKDCIKMNVTYPYIYLPEKLTDEQKEAIKKIINAKGGFTYVNDDIADQAEYFGIEIDCKDFQEPLLILADKGLTVLDLAYNSADDVLKSINNYYVRGYFLEKSLLTEKKSTGNTFTYKGKDYWSGSVNTLDGEIEEVHTFKEAKDADFHHSFYFSYEQQDKMEEGECVFFCIDEEGNIFVDPIGRGDPIDDNDDERNPYGNYNSNWLRNRIKEQIKVKSNESLTESKADQEKFKKWCDDNVADLYSKEGHLDLEKYLGTKDVYKVFNELKPRLKSPDNDMYYWMNWKGSGTGFFNMVRQLGLTQDKIEKEKKSKEGARLVYSDNDWKVYSIDNYEASAKYGANTKWCITGTKRWNNGQNGEGYFNDYYSQGIRFYFFLNKDGEKYAIAYNPEDSNYCEIFNSEDISIPYIPGAPKIDEIKVDYTEEGTTDLDRVASYITSSKLSDEDFINLIEECILQENDSAYEYMLWNSPEGIIDELNDGNYYDEYYLAWLKTNSGKMTSEEFEKETGEEFDPDGWVGDTSMIYNFDLYMLDPKYYNNYEYYAIHGNWGDYDISLYDDRLDVFRDCFERSHLDSNYFSLQLATYYLELIVGGKVKDWENKLKDAGCSDEYINAIKEGIKQRGTLTESLLNEATRSELINKSKKADNYSKNNQKRGKNRYERRLYSRVANSVRQYNKINFDSFFKKDILTIGIEVQGETSNYIVTMQFEGALNEIAREVKANNGKLEFKVIARALARTFNMDNVKVGCSCKDMYYRFNYFAHKNGYGTEVELRPSDITNPTDSKGAGCKHTLLVLSNLDWMMKVASVVNNYIKYCQKYLQNNYATYIFPKIYGMPYNKAIQLSIFDLDGLLPSDQETLTNIASKNLKDRDNKGKFIKGNSMRFQPKKRRGIQPNPNQLTIDFDDEENSENTTKNDAKLGSGIRKGINIPDEEEN